MWRRLAVVWAGMAALIVVLFLPIKTHAVKLDMPAPNASAQMSPEQIDAVAKMFGMAAVGVVILAVLGVCLWLNVRIIRRYRKAG